MTQTLTAKRAATGVLPGSLLVLGCSLVTPLDFVGNGSGGTTTSSSGGATTNSTGGTTSSSSSTGGNTVTSSVGGAGGAGSSGGTAATSAGGTATTSAGGTSATPIGGTATTSAGGTATTSAGGTATTSAGGTATTSAGGIATTSAGGTVTTSAGGTATASTGGTTTCNTSLLQTDNTNCGSCGHDCLGGKCQAGQCQPVVMSSGLNGIQAVALDADNVYVTRWNNPETDGRVMSFPKGGGLSRTLSQGQLNPLGIAVDDTNVYFANFGPQNGIGTGDAGSVAKVPKTGSGNATVVIASNQNSNGHGSTTVAVDGTNIYWGNYWEIMTCPLTGCPNSVASKLCGSGQVTTIAVYNGVVYWTEGEGNRVSMIASTNVGGAATPLASSQDHPYGLALDGTNAYWTNYSEGTVLRAPLGGGGPIAPVASYQVSDASPDYASNLAVDDAFVYWNDSTAHSIMKAPKSGGGAIITLANYGGDDCRYLAVDSVAVYYTCYYAGTLVKIAK